MVFLKIYWYITAFLRKYWLIFLISIILSLIMFTLLVPFLYQNFLTKEKFYIGMVGEYNLNTLPPEITSLIGTSLIKINQDGSFSKNLANKMDIEEEGKKYRFSFDENLKWQDGKKFNLDDLDFQFQDPSIQIIKDKDLIFQLKEVSASFPLALTESLIRFENKKKFGFFDHIEVIGLGDYKMKNFTFLNSSQTTLKEIVLKKELKEYIFRFYYTEDEAILAFKKGEIDFIFDLINFGDLDSLGNTTIKTKVKTNHYLGLFFDNSNTYLTQNVKIAFSYALSKINPNENQIRAIGPINPSSWAFLQATKLYDQNLAKAKERFLADPLPNQLLEFTLSTTQQFVPQANIIKNELETLGSESVLECMNNSEIKEKDRCPNLGLKIHINISIFPDLNNFQLLLIGQEILPDPDQYYLWHSSQITNFTHYKNTKVDSLLEKGRQTNNQKERLVIYQEFQQNLINNPPAIFLHYLNYYDIARSRKLKRADFFSDGFN